MVNLLQRSWQRPDPARSAHPAISWDDYQALLSMSFGGASYGVVQGAPTGDQERIEGNFTGVVQGAFKRNGIVFACILTRMLVFSEARFMFQRIREGRPGDLFGTADLALLEQPWPGGTTGDLLSRMLLDADLAGNAFIARRPRLGGRDRLRRMRPDWVTIVLGSEQDPDTAAHDLDADLLGYLYHPNGPASGSESVVLMPEEVAHFAPIPDPEATYRGMSWMTPVLREVQADQATTTHKLKFFENGATPQVIVSLDASVRPDDFKKFTQVMDLQHRGVNNAYRTMVFGGGADAKVVGADLRQLDFKMTQGAGETRIAAAAGVPPVIVGLSEGLQSATYSNYGQARRRMADGTIRPYWRNAAGSLASIVRPPADARLWYDDRDIPFLREDRRDAAAIQGRQAATIRQLIDAGYEPDAVIEAVKAEDYSILLGRHSGLYSVQLQPPGRSQAAPATPDQPADASGE